MEQSELEILRIENKILKEEIKNRNKWKKINAWTSIIFTSIILLIILWALIQKIRI